MLKIIYHILCKVIYSEKKQDSKQIPLAHKKENNKKRRIYPTPLTDIFLLQNMKIILRCPLSAFKSNFLSLVRPYEKKKQ